MCLALLVLGAACAPTRPGATWGDVAPAWSPVADSVAFVRSFDGPGGGWPPGIYVIGADGGGRRLVLPGMFSSVAWAPSGRHLAFSAPLGLFVCTATGDSVRQLVQSPAYFPSWSPDGDSLAFDDITSIWIVAADGGVPRRVIEGRDPDWSPDGRSLVALLGGRELPGGGIGVVALDGSLRSRVVLDGNEHRAPVWSSAHASIAWNRWVRGANGKAVPQFWMADTSGADARRILWGEGAADWSPDGTRLVVSIGGPAGYELATIGADGTGLRLLTR